MARISITGNVACSTDLQIAGRVQGDVRCSTVFVDEGGAVAGGTYAERVRVSGSVEGTIESGDFAVEPGGRVSDNVSYARLKVSAGATWSDWPVVNGTCGRISRRLEYRGAG